MVPVRVVHTAPDVCFYDIYISLSLSPSPPAQSTLPAFSMTKVSAENGEVQPQKEIASKKAVSHRIRTCARLRMRFLVSPLNRSGRLTYTRTSCILLPYKYPSLLTYAIRMKDQPSQAVSQINLLRGLAVLAKRRIKL